MTDRRRSAYLSFQCQRYDLLVQVFTLIIIISRQYATSPQVYGALVCLSSGGTHHLYDIATMVADRKDLASAVCRAHQTSVTVMLLDLFVPRHRCDIDPLNQYIT